MIDTLTVDNLQIHNTYANGAGYFLTDAQGIYGSPATRQDTYTKSRRHGIINRTKYYDQRTITLTGVVAATDSATFLTMMDNLMGALALGTTHTLYFKRTGGQPEQCTAIVGGEVVVKVSTPVRTQQYSVTFICEDPRIYSQTLNSASYDPTVSGASTGFAFPLSFPLNFGGTGVNELSVSNAGNIATPAIYTVAGPAVNPIIDNDTTSQHIYTTNLSMIQGDSLIIDTGQRTVMLNGVSRPDVIDQSQTSWFDLSPGVSLIRMRAASGMVTGQTSLQAQWRNARI